MNKISKKYTPQMKYRITLLIRNIGLIMKMQCIARWMMKSTIVRICQKDGLWVYAFTLSYFFCPSYLFIYNEFPSYEFILFTFDLMLLNYQFHLAFLYTASIHHKNYGDRQNFHHLILAQIKYYYCHFYQARKFYIKFNVPYFVHMNKQLERDLQSFIQSLKSAQLANVMAHYQQLSNVKCIKNFTKKGMNYQCQIICKTQNVKGYGRNEEQSLSNATKNLLSGFISKNIDIQKITQSLKFKNQESEQQRKTNSQVFHEKQLSLILDDISMIQSNSCVERNDSQRKQKKVDCNCIFYEMNQYQQSEIKHLQARVNLLSEQNQLLKKMLLCSPQRSSHINIDKENDSLYSNNNYFEKQKI